MHSRNLAPTTRLTLIKFCRLLFCRCWSKNAVMYLIAGMILHLQLHLLLWYTLYEGDVHILEEKSVEKEKNVVRQSIILSAAVLILLVSNVSASEKIGAPNAGKRFSEDHIITVLPFDAIPAIKDPRFVSAREAKLRDDSPMIGVSFNGESHAYSIYLLNGHEIVNDVVGGVEVAITW